MLVLKFWSPTYMYELSVIVSVMFLAPIRFLTEQVSWFSFEPDIPDYQIIFLNVLSAAEVKIGDLNFMSRKLARIFSIWLLASRNPSYTFYLKIKLGNALHEAKDPNYVHTSQPQSG